MKYVVYDPVDGEIKRAGRCPANVFLLQALEGEAVMEGEASDVTQYIMDVDGEPVVEDRPVMAAGIDKVSIAADGVEVATISGLPAPCEVFIDSTRYFVTDGSAEISLDTPGTYRVLCRAFPYLDWGTEVTGT